MGLDVYVRWPKMTKEEQQAQITGFRSVGKAGYLRQSWGSLHAWDNVFSAMFPFTWSQVIFPGWDGYNDGEGPDLTNPEERKRLEQNRDILKQYVDSPFPPSDIIRERYFEPGTTPEEAAEIVKKECQHLIDFIDLALSKEGATIHFS